MIRKFLVLNLLILLYAFPGLAQPSVVVPGSQQHVAEDSMACLYNMSNMAEFVKIDVYEYAVAPWRYVFRECPDASKNIYIYGARIYKWLIEKEKDPAVKAGLVDTLMMIYNQRMKFYGQEDYVRGRMALDLLKYEPDRYAEARNWLKRSTGMTGSRTEPVILLNLVQTSVLLYKDGKLPAGELIDDYLLALDILEAQNSADQQKALETLDNLFRSAGVASCEVLEQVFGPRFEQDPGNVKQLRLITGFLDDADCLSSPLYASAAEALYAAEPSPEAAHHLAKLFFRNKDFDKSVEYYREGIDRELDPVSRSRMEYELAMILFSEYKEFKEARDLARQAIEDNPDWGAPYLLIGNIYAASSQSFGENDFEKSTLFWASVDKYRKALEVDPSVKEEATELIERDKQYFPSKEDIFFHGYQVGAPYQIPSWIGENTTIRAR